MLVSLLVSSTSAMAQVRTDNWIWPAVQVEKEFFKDLTMSVNVEGRLNQNGRNVRGFFGELEAKWDFNKYLATSLNYRIGGREADVTDYAKGQRVSLFVYGKFKPGIFALTNRAGVYRQYLETRETPRDYFRNKFTVKVDFGMKVKPLVYAEVFYRLDTDPNKIDEWRYGAGIDYDITKRHSVKPLYIYSKQVNVKKPDIRHVFAFTYTYKIKKKKKDTVEPAD